MTLRVVELFSGIGAQNAALKMSGLDYETVAVCEIDEKAYKAYCAINDECPPNLGDITNVERLSACDLLTFSAPCTDISNAGQRKGMEEGSGTRTALIYEVARLIENTPERERPMYCLGENVPDIVNRKNIKHLMKFVNRMQNLGYSFKYDILNAKDFGIPQNRERCFMIFSRKGNPDFPSGWKLDKCLIDILEPDVQKKYYLSQKAIDGLIFHKKRHEANGNGFGFRPLMPSDIAHAITTGEDYHNNSSYILEIAKTSFDSDRVLDPNYCSDTICAKHTPKIMIKNNTEQGFIEAESGDGIILDQPKSKTKRGRVQKGLSPTIMTSGQVGVLIVDGESYSIRRLTPRECFRLFGFTDEQIDRVMSMGLSDSALYKLAGNSIVVPVLSEIFKTIYRGKKQPCLSTYCQEAQSEASQ